MGRLRRKVIVGASVGVIMAGGAVAALAATGPSSGAASHHAHRSAARPRQRRGHRLATAADYLGLSVPQLRSELRSGKSLAQIANATPGRSAAGLVEVLLSARRERLAASAADAAARVKTEVDRTGGPAARVSPAAAYLGLSNAQLQRELHAGRSLAQIANSTPGKSAAGLVESIVAARKQRLDEAVATGRTTPSTENARLAHVKARVSSRIERVPASNSGAPSSTPPPASTGGDNGAGSNSSAG